MNEEIDDLITLIIPVYNCEKFLFEALESVCRQTYKNLEILIIDDGSKDNTKSICDKFLNRDKRIKYYYQENCGVSSARNLGLKKSNGRWISFLDADDWIEPEFCQKMIKYAIDKQADIVKCGYNRVYENKIDKINCKENKEFTKDEFYIQLLNVQKSMGICCAGIIKKDVIKNIEFDPQIKSAEDALFNIMITKNIKKGALLAEPLYNYRFNSNSAVRSFNENYEKNYYDAMIETKKYIQNKNDIDEKIKNNIYNYIAYHILLISVNFCFHPMNSQKGIELLKNICNKELYKEAIKKSDYLNLSLSRKITLFTLKYKLYYITKIICNIRQNQFKATEKK